MPPVPEATILVVDDDPVILDLLAINFELEGYEVLQTRSTARPASPVPRRPARTSSSPTS